jgi:hypothetical protein
MTAHQEARLQQQMEEPHSGLGLFDLPMGVIDAEGELHRQIQLREITGVEEDILLSKTGSIVTKFNDVLTNCVLKIGHISDRQKISKLVLDMRTGDRTFILLALRRVSLGDTYPFEFKCPDATCKAKHTLEVDLSELEIALPDGFDPDEPEAVLKRELWEVQLPSGIKAVIKVMTGRLEFEIDQKAKRNAEDRLSRMMRVRIASLDDKEPTVRHIQALTMRDRDFLRGFFDQIDGGVNTTVEVECPSCMEESEVEVNPGQEGFFFPSVLTKRSRRRSAT